MTIINPKSISGITSITTASGADNLLTVHTNNTTERVRINNDGDVIVGSGITVSPDGDIFATGVTTATTFSGSGASLTNLPAANITGTLPAISGANLTGVLKNIVEDTSPQLGGDLDTNSHNIILDDSHYLYLGDTSDASLFNDGSNVYLKNYSGGTDIQGTTYVQLRKFNDGNLGLKYVVDGALELYHNGTKKFETTSNGATVTGTLTAGAADLGSGDLTLTGNINIADSSGGGNNRIIFGAGDDLQIWHDGSDSYIADEGTGALKLLSNLFRVNNAANDEAMIKAEENAGVTLSFNGSTKLETKTEGTKITGYIKATDDGNLLNTGVYHESLTTYNNQHTHWFYHAGSNNSEQYGIRIKSAHDGNDTINQIQCSSGSATAFVVRRNGSVESRSNSFGGVSDIKLKENIVDANSQWDDIKNIKVRNFNFKDNPTKTMIGVVAQEIELVSAGLVEDIPDLDDTNTNLGTVTKVVKSSILYMKAIKALQEAQTRIEVLETRLNNAGIAT